MIRYSIGRERLPSTHRRSAIPGRSNNSIDQVLALQSTAGNRAVVQALSDGLIVSRDDDDDDDKSGERRNGRADERTIGGKWSRRANTRYRDEPFRRPPRSARLREREGAAAQGAPLDRPQVPEIPELNPVFWTGGRRGLNFAPGVVENVLAEKGSPQRDLAGRETYKCARCGGHFPTKSAGRKHERHIQIDHKEPYWDYIMGGMEPERLQYQDHAFVGYSLAKARALYSDEDNLRPLCSTCNSGKSGPKDRDHDDPTKHLDVSCKACQEWHRDRQRRPDGDNGPGAGGGGSHAMIPG